MNFSGCSSYEQIVEELGFKVITSQELGDYQGDLFILAKKDWYQSSGASKYALFVTGYGSCSGCDALQDAIDTWDGNERTGKVVEIADDMLRNATLGDAAFIRDHIVKRDEANSWFANDAGWDRTRTALLEALDKESKDEQPIVTASATVVPGRGEGDSPTDLWVGPYTSVREQAEPGVRGESADPGELKARIANLEHDPVNHPSHYTWLPGNLEAIDITENFNFTVGNALKYIMRYERKGSPVQDLEKARWYLDREIARLKQQPGWMGRP